MQFLLTVTASLLAASQTMAYSLCNPRNYPYAGQNVSIPIEATPTKVLSYNGQNVPVSASGTITIVDGCSFTVSNFALQAPNDLQFGWYGGVDGDDAAVRLSLVVINPTQSPQTQTFTFISSAGAAVSFADFNQFRLFDAKTLSFIAMANIKASPSSSTTSTTGTTSTSRSPSSPSNYATSTSTVPKSTGTSTAIIQNGAWSVSSNAYATGPLVIALFACMV